MDHSRTKDELAPVSALAGVDDRLSTLFRLFKFILVRIDDVFRVQSMSVPDSDPSTKTPILPILYLGLQPISLFFLLLLALQRHEFGIPIRDHLIPQS